MPLFIKYPAGKCVGAYKLGTGFNWRVDGIMRFAAHEDLMYSVDEVNDSGDWTTGPKPELD